MRSFWLTVAVALVMGLSGVAGTLAPASAPLPQGEQTYTLLVATEDGQGVAGCMVGFCTDVQCVPVATGEDGRAVYTAPAARYHLQLLRLPQGYVSLEAEDLYTDVQGGELVWRVRQE